MTLRIPLLLWFCALAFCFVSCGGRGAEEDGRDEWWLDGKEGVAGRREILKAPEQDCRVDERVLRRLGSELRVATRRPYLCDTPFSCLALTSLAVLQGGRREGGCCIDVRGRAVGEESTSCRREGSGPGQLRSLPMHVAVWKVQRSLTQLSVEPGGAMFGRDAVEQTQDISARH